ncbi:MAG: hypothetical protein JXR60_06065 [Bacteroidales bacterium]|nr:hypothetical protein [Bacteroidales bacterium]
MKTKKTKIQKQRSEYQQILHAVLKRSNINEFDYNLCVFWTGMSFLELHYPVDSEYDKYREAIHQDAMFWNWWRTEFKSYEEKLIAMLYNEQKFIDKSQFNNTMHIFMFSPEVEHVYQENYLKILSNIKI